MCVRVCVCVRAVFVFVCVGVSVWVCWPCIPTATRNLSAMSRPWAGPGPGVTSSHSRCYYAREVCLFGHGPVCVGRGGELALMAGDYTPVCIAFRHCSRVLSFVRECVRKRGDEIQ